MADNIIVLVFCNACATSTAWKIAKIKYNGLEKLTEGAPEKRNGSRKGLRDQFTQTVHLVDNWRSA